MESEKRDSREDLVPETAYREAIANALIHRDSYINVF